MEPMLAILLVGCAFHSPEADLSGFEGGKLTIVQDGVVLTAPTGCPRLAASVEARLNGQPMQLVETGGKYLGSSPDGLTPMMRCADPTFAAGTRPTGTVRIELSDGTRQWDISVSDVGAPRALSVTSGPLVSGGAVVLETTPATATWTLPGLQHSGNDLSIQPTASGQSEAFYRACIVSVNGPDFTTVSGANEYGSLIAAGTATPGRIAFVLPTMSCTGAAELRYHGAVELSVSGCPAGMTCTAWEETEARVPVDWAPGG